MGAINQALASYSAASGGSAPTPDILWWKLNEGSGASITGDGSNGGDDGTTNGTWVSGINGSTYAVDLSGSSQKAYSNSSISPGTNVVTITFWVNFDAYTTPRGIASLGVDTSANSFNIHWNSNIVCEIYGTTGLRKENFIAPSVSTVVFVACVLDASASSGVGNVKLYYDAVEQTMNSLVTNTKTGSSNYQTGVFTLGDYFGLFLNGQLDDVRIYSYELTGAQITDVMNDPQ